MDAFYKAEECQPAHEVKEEDKISYTIYKDDNYFDKVALSQLITGQNSGNYTTLE